MRPCQVIDNYETLENPGAHIEYQKLGLDFAYTRAKINSIVDIIKKGANYSVVESMERGQKFGGRSIDTDFETGGVNSVFLSTITKNQGNIYNKDIFSYSGGYGEAMIVYKPEIFDRIDWYAYNDDNYGSTRPKDLDERPTPEEYFKRQSEMNHPENEVCFPHGINNNQINYLVVQFADRKKIMTSMLEKDGISEINGLPIDQMIISYDEFKKIRKKPIFKRIMDFFKR